MPYMNLEKVAKYLGVSKKTVYRLIDRDEIPAVKVGKQWRFNRKEVEAWLRKERPEAWADEHYNDISHERDPNFSLYSLLKTGLVSFGVPGSSRDEVLENALSLIELEPTIDGEALLEAIIAREELCSTGVGHGIALPHPRLTERFVFSRSSISFCLLSQKIEFGAVDGLPVDKLFFVFGKNIKEHLNLLKILARLFHEKDFIDFLSSPFTEAELLGKVKLLEESLKLKITP